MKFLDFKIGFHLLTKTTTMKKKLLLLLGICLSIFQIDAQTLNQKMYIDFGTTGGTGGGITASPDANANYWNNATNGAVGASVSLVNSANASTGYTMTVTDNFVINAVNNYGPTAPTQSNLGDLAIGAATQDYFYLETAGSANTTGQLTISNLNPSKSYKFNIFGSRPTNAVRVSGYAFAGANTFTGQLQTSDGGTGNLNTILATSLLTPNASGVITINMSIISGGFAYINCMRIEEYTAANVDITGLAVNGNDINASGQTSQMSVTVTPSNATIANVNWSVNNTNVATINTNGLLTPIADGAVIVTATSTQNPAVFNSKTINVSNQITALYFSGTATENGTDITTAIPMKMVTGTSVAVSNVYEIYTSLNTAGTFNFYTSQDISGAVYGSNSAGTLTLNAPAIDPSEVGPVLITVNLNTNTYTILPINWSVVGSSVTNSWNGDEPLVYQGNAIWSATVNMNVVNTDTSPRFVFKANASWDYTMKKVQNTVNSVRMESQATTYNIPIQDIGLGYNTFVITLNLKNYTYGIQCTQIDNLKVSVMGSSVSNGQGATSNQGYAYKYGQLLNNRFTAGEGLNWTTSNLAVNGNNTVAVLNRWEKDLIGNCSKYVIYALSLGNEGIHENGQPSYDQFRDNMLLLIDKAVQNGKIPVIMNNYTRADYNTADYNYIKQMNMLIHQWNVPSINMLGAIDNGAGQWASGYQSDALHPNDAGHSEFFYAMVPSLFDALDQLKPQPQITSGTALTINNASPYGPVKFTPENIIHPFTVSFDVKLTASGTIARFTTTTPAVGTLAVNTNGTLTYTSPSGNTITSSAVINDNQWHKITLTHFYARGKSFLYTDNTLSGSLDENLEAKTFSINPANAPVTLQYRNWFFYRSGMNTEEITALNNNQMLKSSLELYAPLDETNATPFINLAQSTNSIDSSAFLLGNQEFNLESQLQYINPVKEVLTINLNNITIDKLELYNTIGVLVKSIKNSNSINTHSLSSGIYLVKIYSDKGNATIKIIKE